MSHILFSFVGLPGNYRSTVYGFSRRDGDRFTTRVFFHALAQRMARDGARLDRIVLCGTTGSGWEALAVALSAPESEAPSTLPEEAADFPPHRIAALEAEYARLLDAPASIELAGYAETPARQTDFVAMVAAHVREGDTVHFDVSHGLRHLPMVALVAALAVQRLKNARIGGVWTGAYEMGRTPEGVALTGQHGASPALRLDGLVDIAAWLTSAAVFDATGDVAAFAGPLRAEGEDALADRLEAAGFAERVSGASSAREAAATARAAILDAPGATAGIVRPAIEARLAWSERDRGGAFDLALEFARRGVEVRALTLAFETVMHRLIGAASDLRGRAIGRQHAGSAVGEACAHIGGKSAQPSTPEGRYARAFLQLRELRNKVVHDDAPTAFVRSAIGSHAEFNRVFADLVRALRPPPPPTLVAAVAHFAGKPR